MTTIYTDVSPLGRIETDALAHTYTSNSDGTLATDTVTYGGSTWVKTYGYSGGKLVSESAWVKQ